LSLEHRARADRRLAYARRGRSPRALDGIGGVGAPYENYLLGRSRRGGDCDGCDRVLVVAARRTNLSGIRAGESAAPNLSSGQRAGRARRWMLASRKRVAGHSVRGSGLLALDTYETRAAAEAAKGPQGSVVEALGKIWLFTVANAGWRPPGGVRIAEIGPLFVKSGERYTALYAEGISKCRRRDTGASSSRARGLVHDGRRNVCRDTRGQNGWARRRNQHYPRRHARNNPRYGHGAAAFGLARAP
jgi:hypothetical protein